MLCAQIVPHALVKRLANKKFKLSEEDEEADGDDLMADAQQNGAQQRVQVGRVRMCLLACWPDGLVLLCHICVLAQLAFERQACIAV